MRRARYEWTTTTTVLRELPDGSEVEIDVKCHVIPGEREWFNPMEGVGHPGSGPDVEVLSATLDGKEIDLTDAEIKDIEERVIDEYVDDTGDRHY